MRNGIIDVLIFFIVIFLFLVSSTYAISRSNASVSGSVAAATWNVSLNQTGVNNTINISPNAAAVSYTLNVRNDSEVDVVYSIVISNLPSGIEVELDNDGNYETQDANNTITFTDAGTILYSSQSHEKSHTLNFRAVSGAQNVSNREVDIDVIVRQAL